MQEMKVNQWMTAEDLTNLIAIAEMTPGPLGINCATFAGMQTAGVLGGIAAVMGVLMPAYTLTLGVAVCFAKFRGKMCIRDRNYTDNYFKNFPPMCQYLFEKIKIKILTKK